MADDMGLLGMFGNWIGGGDSSPYGGASNVDELGIRLPFYDPNSANAAILGQNGLGTPLPAGASLPTGTPEEIAAQNAGSSNSGATKDLSAALSGAAKAMPGGSGVSNTPGGSDFKPMQLTPPTNVGQGGGALPVGFGMGQGPGGMSANPLLLQFLKLRLGGM